IRLNGSILGLSKGEIDSAMETIIDFSGLRDFIDDPVKHYSSGMYVRLGFSVAVHMKPDVLLVDEVLAVGDEEFQRKCFDHLYTLRRQGRTIVVVSHGLGQLEGLCDEVAWLDHGTVQEIGPATEVIGSYLHQVNTEEAKANADIAATRDDTTMRAGSGTIRSTGVRLVDEAHNPINHTETGTTFGIEVDLHCYEEVLGPNVRLAFQHETGALVTMMSNHRHGFDFGHIDGERMVTALLTDNPLLPGRYRVHIDIFDHTGSVLIDNWDDALEFTVRSPRGEIGQGFVELPYTYEINCPFANGPSRVAPADPRQTASRPREALPEAQMVGTQYRQAIQGMARRLLAAAARIDRQRNPHFSDRPGFQPPGWFPARVHRQRSPANCEELATRHQR
ncbi:MAG TPA: Wzt carbohydrate-binding domain-containing protein, partial [Acidimicrobiia bacterium]